MSNADEVFLLTGNEIHPLASRPFKAGLFGKTLEDALQTLIERQPNILNGRQIEPGDADPPRFVLLCRETRVGDWSLDHLLVDQRGVLALVEAKLLQNPEARRAVVGQILDYAASAQESWGDGRLRGLASDYWRSKGRSIDDVLREQFGDIDVDVFWAQVDGNLEQLNLRLVFAGDELRPEVRRVIEFLNQQMRTVQVFGLEIRCFGEEPNTVVVPFLVGLSHASGIQKAHRPPASVRSWTVRDLAAAFTEMSDKKCGGSLLRLLNWADRSGCVLTGKTQAPLFGLRGKGGQRILSISQEWGIYLYLGTERYGGEAARDAFIRDLQDIDMLPEEFSAAETVGKKLECDLSELTEDQISKFLVVLSKYCQLSSGEA